MTIIVSIGGVVTDWSEENQDGEYHAWLDAPFSQPGVTTTMVQRTGTWPVGTGVGRAAYTLPPIYVDIMDEENQEALRRALLAGLDTSQAFKALIVADDDGGNERYWMCSFEAREERDDARGTGLSFAVTAVVVDDPYPRRTALSSASAALTASGQTLVVTNGGDVDAFPVMEIELTSARTGNGHWKWRRFVVARWRAAAGATYYPTQISGDNAAWDTTGLTTTKAIDWTSVGVLEDGVEVDRWFSEEVEDNDRSFDQVDTRLWMNLDFRSTVAVTLSGALGNSAGDVAGGIVVNEDISAFPPAGILYAPAQNELFVYLSRDVRKRTFHGVTRAAYGSSAASHSAGAALEWIQHEVFIVYGPQAGLAKAADDTMRPYLELPSSDNDKWDWGYLEGTGERGFGSDSEPNRAGRWTPVTAGDGGIFTADEHGTDVDPFDVLGFENGIAGNENLARWQIYLPAGLNTLDANGKAYETTAVEAVKFYASVDGVNWTRIDAYPDAGGVGWFEFGPHLTNQTAGWRYLRFELLGEVGEVEIYQASVGLEADTVPVVRLMPEAANYALDMTITNETTGEWIELSLPAGLSTGDVVVVDTEAKTVTAEPFGRNVYRILEKSSHRPAMLRLAPGANTLRVNETGLAGVELTVVWRERLYT